jgi:hypothetical protein
MLYLMLFSTLSGFSVIFSQTPDVTNEIIVRNNIDTIKVLSFGLDVLATDGIDEFLGELELPPIPPIEGWDVRLILPPNNWQGLASWKDYRFESNFPYTGQREFRIQYQIGEFTDTLFFEWNLPAEVTGVLQDLITGTLVNIPMNGIGSYLMIRGIAPDPLVLTQLKMTINYNNVIADVNESQPQILDEFILEQNYPNPFNPSTTINFSLPVSSEIKLKVFNLLGKQVASISEGFYTAGNHSLEFNGKGLASGIYIYQLTHSSGMISKKMTLLK